MRQLYIIIVLTLISSFSLHAQSVKDRLLENSFQDYYSGKTSVKARSIEYKIKAMVFEDNHAFDRLYLVNKDNSIPYTSPIDRTSGEKIGKDRIPPVKCDEETVSRIFSEELKDVSFGSFVFQEGRLGIFVRFDTDTGIINEVEFTLYPKGEDKVLFSIPPTVFERIEQRLKEELVYSVEERFSYPSYYTDAFFVKISKDKTITIVQ